MSFRRPLLYEVTPGSLASHSLQEFEACSLSRILLLTAVSSLARAQQFGKLWMNNQSELFSNCCPRRNPPNASKLQASRLFGLIVLQVVIPKSSQAPAPSRPSSYLVATLGLNILTTSSRRVSYRTADFPCSEAKALRALNVKTQHPSSYGP